MLLIWTLGPLKVFISSQKDGMPVTAEDTLGKMRIK